MDNLIFVIGSIVSALIAGSILGYYARQTIAKKQAGTIEAKLNKLVSEAKTEAKETLIKAKEKANKILEEIKTQEKDRQKHIFIRSNRQCC